MQSPKRYVSGINFHQVYKSSNNFKLAIQLLLYRRTIARDENILYTDICVGTNHEPAILTLVWAAISICFPPCLNRVQI